MICCISAPHSPSPSPRGFRELRHDLPQPSPLFTRNPDRSCSLPRAAVLSPKSRHCPFSGPTGTFLRWEGQSCSLRPSHEHTKALHSSKMITPLSFFIPFLLASNTPIRKISIRALCSGSGTVNISWVLTEKVLFVCHSALLPHTRRDWLVFTAVHHKSIQVLLHWFIR